MLRPSLLLAISLLPFLLNVTASPIPEPDDPTVIIITQPRAPVGNPLADIQVAGWGADFPTGAGLLNRRDGGTKIITQRDPAPVAATDAYIDLPWEKRMPLDGDGDVARVVTSSESDPDSGHPTGETSEWQGDNQRRTYWFPNEVGLHRRVAEALEPVEAAGNGYVLFSCPSFHHFPLLSRKTCSIQIGSGLAWRHRSPEANPDGAPTVIITQRNSDTLKEPRVLSEVQDQPWIRRSPEAYPAGGTTVIITQSSPDTDKPTS
jgi:hypothetical protein